MVFFRYNPRFFEVARQRAVDNAEVRTNLFEKIPIPKIPPEAQKPFIDLVDKILKITSEENYDSKNPPIEQKNWKLKLIAWFISSTI